MQYKYNKNTIQIQYSKYETIILFEISFRPQLLLCNKLPYHIIPASCSNAFKHNIDLCLSSSSHTLNAVINVFMASKLFRTFDMKFSADLSINYFLFASLKLMLITNISFYCCLYIFGTQKRSFVLGTRQAMLVACICLVRQWRWHLECQPLDKLQLRL